MRREWRHQWISPPLFCLASKHQHFARVQNACGSLRTPPGTTGSLTQSTVPHSHNHGSTHLAEQNPVELTYLRGIGTCSTARFWLAVSVETSGALGKLKKTVHGGSTIVHSFAKVDQSSGLSSPGFLQRRGSSRVRAQAG